VLVVNLEFGGRLPDFPVVAAGNMSVDEEAMILGCFRRGEGFRVGACTGAGSATRTEGVDRNNSAGGGLGVGLVAARWVGDLRVAA
jgi:hypothetical protein